MTSPRVALAAALILLSITSVLTGAGQAATGTGVQAFLRTQLHASDSELSSLSEGQAVVKNLPATTKREMTTAGGVRIRGATITRFVAQFKTLEGFRTSQFVLQIGKFSEQPQLRDLDALTLDAEDIDALKKCRVAECDVQLADADIRRFNTEVNWKSPTAARDATTLYKAVLFAHLSDYRTGGRARLVKYHDRETPIRLETETTALLDARPSLLDHMPPFQSYVRQYPSGTLPNTEDFFYWAKEAFGFKPVVGLNHVSVHTDQTGGGVTIVTTQIYASHYMDGSVAISSLIPAVSGGDRDFYWLYVNRSRVGRLGTLLGTLSRPIVQRRARAGLVKSLLQTKQRLEAMR